MRRPISPRGAALTLIDGVGCWVSEFTPTHRFTGRPALFLDRDGVVIEEVGFLCDPSGVRLIDGSAEIIGGANSVDVAVVVVTNQSGIGRGRFGWDAFEAVQQELAVQLAARGAAVDLTLACGYYEAGVDPFAISHTWRKPGSGMLAKAGELLGIDLARSWIVGDRSSDIAAGRAGGLAGGVHVMTGHGTPEHREAALALANEYFVVDSATSIADAAYVVEQMKGAHHAD